MTYYIFMFCTSLLPTARSTEQNVNELDELLINYYIWNISETYFI